MRHPAETKRWLLTRPVRKGIIDEGTGIEIINVGGYAEMLRGWAAGKA